MDDNNQCTDSLLTSTREIDSFLSKFRYLCSTGFKASLNISCENGRTVVDLHVDLGCTLPPVGISPPTIAPSMSPRSPSYYRCLKRRKAKRDSLDSFVNSRNSFPVTNEVNSSSSTYGTEVLENARFCES